MGQYYFPIFLSANGGKTLCSFYSHDYDNGLKLLEHSWMGNRFVNSVVAKGLSLLKPFTIVWLGDYAELDEDVLPLKDHRAFDPANNKGGIGRDYVRMFNKARKVYEGSLYRVGPDDEGIREYLKYAEDAVFYDTVTHQKLSLRKYAANAEAMQEASGKEYPGEWIVHPLPLLTCLGNGKGGGDYRNGHDMEWVGAWALHPIAILPESAGLPDPDGEWEDISEKVWFEEDLTY